MRYVVNLFATQCYGRDTYSGYRVADIRTGCLIATLSTMHDAQALADTLNTHDPYRDL